MCCAFQGWGSGSALNLLPAHPAPSAAPLCRHSTTFQHVPTEYSRFSNHVSDLPRADRVHHSATLFEPPVRPDIVVTPAWHAFGRHHPPFPPSVLPLHSPSSTSPLISSPSPSQRAPTHHTTPPTIRTHYGASSTAGIKSQNGWVTRRKSPLLTYSHQNMPTLC